MSILVGLTEWCAGAAKSIVLALLVYWVGKVIIQKLLGLIEHYDIFTKMDPTAASFAKNVVKWVLYIILIITMISILGIPMASVITVLASAGVAIGMAMQGSLGNLAGGIMLMLFRPFNVGDSISAAGIDGSVREIGIFYTVLGTADNKIVSVPNGTLMSSTVVNLSREKTRRVDLEFIVSRGSDIAGVRSMILDIIMHNSKALTEPSPFTELSGGSNEGLIFTVRVWSKSEDYWELYYQLTSEITKALAQAGIGGPSMHIIQETR